MKIGGLFINLTEKSIKIRFCQKEQDDYQLMEILIGLLLSRKRDRVIRRLFDLMFVVISESAYFDDDYFNKLKKGYYSVKKQRENG